MEAFFAKVNYLFARFTQGANGGHRDTHVGKKLHAAEMMNG
jgi:hypothetical protein